VLRSDLSTLYCFQSNEVSIIVIKSSKPDIETIPKLSSIFSTRAANTDNQDVIFATPAVSAQDGIVTALASQPSSQSLLQAIILPRTTTTINIGVGAKVSAFKRPDAAGLRDDRRKRSESWAGWNTV